MQRAVQVEVILEKAGRIFRTSAIFTPCSLWLQRECGVDVLVFSGLFAVGFARKTGKMLTFAK
jgi:hypothetical protein